MNTENDLRAQLAAAINTAPARSYPDPSPAVTLPPPPPPHNNLDPVIAAHTPAMMSNATENGEDSTGQSDGRKGGKRELSQSKRAAQNRAAQRAFRQRKEGYIKKLEEQVRELHTLEENYKAIQNENYSLREYIIHLQSRLIESQGDFPQPPPNVNLSQPRPDPMTDPMMRAQHHPVATGQPTPPSTTAPMGASAINALQASAAQAVAGMAESKPVMPPSNDAYAPHAKVDGGPRDEDMRRQFPGAQEGLPQA